MNYLLILVSLSAVSAILDLSAVVDERIITDRKAIVSGVPVDYGYNESYSGTDKLNSVPGCPKSEVGYPWVYYGTEKSSKCYLAGHRGPCPEGQLLFIEKGSPYAFCNCECFEEIERDKYRNNQFCQNEFGREVVFHPEVKKCYVLYDRGPCREDEWLVKVEVSSRFPSEGDYTVCEKRRCDEGEIPVKSEDGEHCSRPFPPLSGISSVLYNDCENEGMKYSPLLKRCVRIFNFKF